ncbi:MAG: class II aldolase/adducin family protein [Acidobacteria bacterium]|nr:class II aldolase/adducin family protein [Acidobacteriota bacterium]
MGGTEQGHRQSIVEVGRLVLQKNWVAASDGNISIRLDDGRILCTPSGVCKGAMRPEDLIICDLDGRRISGDRECTSEIAMHTAIYARRPDVTAVVHAHPPYSTGFAAAGRALDLAVLPEVIVSLGCIPLAAYGLPGTPELTEGMLPYIAKCDAMLLENHGVVCYGETVWKAYARMEKVEQTAHITLVAEMLGGPRVLGRADVRRLFEARTRYGIRSHTTFEPGFPVVAEDLEDSQPRYRLTRDEIASIVDEALRAHEASARRR